MSKFDITKHKWSDNDTCILSGSHFYSILSNKLVIGCSQSKPVTLNKDDAIAIAKHFKIIDEMWDA